ncbi:sporulation killing factor [Massilibacterium senegalense]|uniref:sporulation killing factor n=1 Tax=Massilibacterium senegalense TaxID=1632858 RepID=UPI00093AAE67|nr:sporulation killing factor [Massilibacterium senegalense]
MKENEKKQNWESTHSSAQKQAVRPLVKSVGCAACWAAHSISLTRVCIPPVTPINAAL